MIYTSEATQYPIVTFNERSIGYIKEKAKDMVCLIPKPLCLEDFKSASVRGRRLPDNVLLDEAGVVIRDALNAYLGTNVVAAIMTDALREHYSRMNKE